MGSFYKLGDPVLGSLHEGSSHVGSILSAPDFLETPIYYVLHTIYHVFYILYGILGPLIFWKLSLGIQEVLSLGSSSSAGKPLSRALSPGDKASVHESLSLATNTAVLLQVLI